MRRKKKQKREKIFLSELPRHLQGPSNNKWGGHNSQRIRPLKGSTFGPASECRVLSEEEKIKIAEELGMAVAEPKPVKKSEPLPPPRPRIQKSKQPWKRRFYRSDTHPFFKMFKDKMADEKA